MKRIASLIVGGIIGIIGLVGAPLTAHADVNSFTISNYTIVYNLGSDSMGRSTLKTTETITADFPDSNQNHGIERAIPLSYQNHPTQVDVTSVKNQVGQAIHYTTYKDDSGNLVVRAGQANQYVHGEQTYVITYTQHDVTGYFKDTTDDEFYWNTDGTDWAVPINHLSVTLHVASNVAQTLNSKTACYQGASGSDASCVLTKTGNTFSVEASNLAANQNVTLAVGFTAGTFRAYSMSPFDRFMQIATIVWVVMCGAGVLIMVWISIRYRRDSRCTRELGTIIAEYTPPSEASVTTSASVLSHVKSAFAAQLIDFAVRGYVRIYELDEKFMAMKYKDYRLEIVKDISDLRDEEQEVLRDIFAKSTGVGRTIKLSSLQNNDSVSMAMLDNTSKLTALVRGVYGLQARNPEKRRQYNRLALLLIIVGVLTLNPVIAFDAGLALLLGYLLWPLTDKGLALLRHLKGLRLYIKVAEVDRIKMLQSASTAEKLGGFNPNDPVQLVKLYEITLPYAILFGQEKTWNAALGRYFEQVGAQPGWFVGTTPGLMNAAAFSGALASFSNSANYSATSTSPSGGSGGSGFSGGGGGGGGGGGW